MTGEGKRLDLLDSEWRQISATEIEVDMDAVLARVGKPIITTDALDVSLYVK